MTSIRRFVLVPLLLCAFAANAEKREFDFQVDVHVDVAGTVTAADVVADIAPEFEATLVALVRQWKFRTGLRNGAPVAVDTTLYTHVVAEIDAGTSAKITAKYIDHGPRYLKTAPPAYPSTAMHRRIQGEVIIEAQVAADGSAESLGIYSARVYGGKSAAKLLSKAATDSLKNWRLQPERIDGVAVASKILIPIMFTLQGRPAELETIIAPPPEDEATVAAVQVAANGKRALALDNSTGLELVSDGSSS